MHELMLYCPGVANLRCIVKAHARLEDVPFAVPRDERDAGCENAAIDPDVDRKDAAAHRRIGRWFEEVTAHRVLHVARGIPKRRGVGGANVLPFVSAQDHRKRKAGGYPTDRPRARHAAETSVIRNASKRRNGIDWNRFPGETSASDRPRFGDEHDPYLAGETPFRNNDPRRVVRRIIRRENGNADRVAGGGAEKTAEAASGVDRERVDDRRSRFPHAPSQDD